MEMKNVWGLISFQNIAIWLTATFKSSNISIGIPYTFLMIYEEKSRIRKRVYSLMINGQSVLIFKDFYDKQSLQ